MLNKIILCVCLLIFNKQIANSYPTYYNTKLSKENEFIDSTILKGLIYEEIFTNIKDQKLKLTSDRFNKQNAAIEILNSDCGQSDYFLVNLKNKKPLKSISISFWVLKYEGFKNGNLITFLENEKTIPSLVFNSNIQYYLRSNQHNNYTIKSNFPYRVKNEWVHFLISYDGNSFDIYQNGINVDSKYFPFYVNFNINCLFGQELNGKIDDILIWDRKLNLREVDNLYKQQSNISPSNVF